MLVINLGTQNDKPLRVEWKKQKNQKKKTYEVIQIASTVSNEILMRFIFQISPF